MTRLPAVVTVLGVPAFATVLRATPFGGDDAGEIPADAPAAPITRCENRVAKAAGRLAAADLDCHVGRVTGRLPLDTMEDDCEGPGIPRPTCDDLGGTFTATGICPRGGGPCEG